MNENLYKYRASCFIPKPIDKKFYDRLTKVCSNLSVYEFILKAYMEAPLEWFYLAKQEMSLEFVVFLFIYCDCFEEKDSFTKEEHLELIGIIERWLQNLILHLPEKEKSIQQMYNIFKFTKKDEEYSFQLVKNSI